MAAIKDVRRRIKAVRGIQQVTKAMKMVATVKMRRVQDRVVQARPYVDALYEMAGKLAAAGEGAIHPLLDARPEGSGPEAIVVVGSDRGLCGAFNMNLCRHVIAKTQGTSPRMVLVGRKVKDIFKRQSYEVCKDYEKLVFPVTWEEAERVARDLLALYNFAGLARIRIAYQRFVSPGVSRVALVPWLPFTAAADSRSAPSELRCEPSVAAVLDNVLPRALTGQLYRALLESQASEQGARMVAMENATTNAGELSSDLTLLANKLRQGGITKELLEITTGAESLKN
jgi:F-type H+-transporting ATPase subunit gamma